MRRLVRLLRPEEATLAAFVGLLGCLMFYAGSFQFRWRQARWLSIAIALTCLVFVRALRAAHEGSVARAILGANAERTAAQLRAAVLPALRTLRDFLPFFACISVYEALHDLTPVLTPRLVDGALSAIDQALFGGIPSLLLEPYATPVLTRLLASAYGTYFFAAPGLAAIFYYARNERAFRDLLLSLVVVTYVGYLGYLLVPAVGPYIYHAELFAGPLPGGKGNFILAAVDGVKGTALATSARDCFPSLHTATTLVVLIHAFRSARRLFFLYLPVALALVFATVYLRYHYLADLAAGALLAFVACRVGPAADRAWSKLAAPSAEPSASACAGTSG